MNAAAGIALALLSSVTTAAAHALLKAGRDKLAIRALIGAVGTIALGPVCLFVPPPDAGMLPWLLTANILHTVYQLVLIRSYQANDFAVAYPVARGISPILTAVIGIIVLGDRITPAALVGVALVTAGVLSIAAGRSIARTGLVAAIAAGVLTTTYTVVDAHAIRLAPTAMTFIAWFFALDGVFMFPIFAFARRGQVFALLRAEGLQGVLAGVITLICFGAALIALRIAPIGIVSALRETSVLFAVLIAAFALGERIDHRRAIGALVIAIGAAAIVLAA